MLSFLNKYGYNVHSQNSEDGVIAECLKRIGLTSGLCVEAGGHDGLWLSNTRHLLENGWRGLFIEGLHDLYLKSKENWKDNPRVRHQCCYVDEKNINAFVHDDCDLLSLDTDGLDYEIFRGLQAKPKIAIIEIDSSVPPNQLLRDDGLGCTYQNTVSIGIEKGYFLLCHTGNLILIDEQYKHLFPEVKSRHPLIDSEFYFNRSWLKPEDAA